VAYFIFAIKLIIMGKIHRYGFFILGIAFIAVMITLLFPENKIINPVLMINIVLFSITISVILAMISLENKQHKNKGKLSRYLMYITATIVMTGFILRVNRIAYGKMALTIGLIGFAFSTVLIFINVIKQRKMAN